MCAAKLPRKHYRLSLSGVDHVYGATVPPVFDGERYNAADAYEPPPELNVTAATKPRQWHLPRPQFAIVQGSRLSTQWAQTSAVSLLPSTSTHTTTG